MTHPCLMFAAPRQPFFPSMISGAPKPVILCALLVCAGLLGACQGAGREMHAGGESTADELCLQNSCAELIELVAIPDAENIHFSPEGRLFVTGGSNIYEIRGDLDQGFEAIALVTQSCNFTGMAQKGGILYALCGDGRLYAGPIDPEPALQIIFQMENMCIANGTALGPDGNLYVVDEPLDPSCLPPDPKIARLTLDPFDPLHVLSQDTWLQGDALGTLPFGVGTESRFPNGLAVRGNRFFSTDGGSIFYLDLLPDGSAGPVTPLFFEVTAHDDLSLAGDSLLVTDFFVGRIFQLSLDGELLQQTDPATFDSPSSVQLAMPPMFRSDDILVTEKGLLLEQNLPIDVLSLWRRRSVND